MKLAKRMELIPPYLFAELDRKKEEAISKGIDVINLGIGDPDYPTPKHIIDKMSEEIYKTENHNYPPYDGTKEFKKAVAEYYLKRFNVELDYNTEVLCLIGSKEGLAHIHLAYVDAGDYNLVPDPAYPVYKITTFFAGGIPYMMPLLEENNFLPDFEKIPQEVARKTKLMFLNYPNNPTGAIANLEFFEKAVHFAKKYEILICHDLAYSEMTFDNYKAPSFLEVKGSKDICIEFNSLSKTYNMTGWRIGMAVGNKEAISNLGKIKNNIDSGVFKAIQRAGITALISEQDSIYKMNNIYQERRDIVINTLSELGWSIPNVKATFYMWLKTPKGFSSTEFCSYVLEKAGIIITPGIGYGQYGEGYFRLALTVSEDRLKLAMQRLIDNNITFS